MDLQHLTELLPKILSSLPALVAYIFLVAAALLWRIYALRIKALKIVVEAAKVTPDAPKAAREVGMGSLSEERRLEIQLAILKTVIIVAFLFAFCLLGMAAIQEASRGYQARIAIAQRWVVRARLVTEAGGAITGTVARVHLFILGSAALESGADSNGVATFESENRRWVNEHASVKVDSDTWDQVDEAKQYPLNEPEIQITLKKKPVPTSSTIFKFKLPDRAWGAKLGIFYLDGKPFAQIAVQRPEPEARLEVPSNTLLKLAASGAYLKSYTTSFQTPPTNHLAVVPIPMTEVEGNNGDSDASEIVVAPGEEDRLLRMKEIRSRNAPNVDETIKKQSLFNRILALILCYENHDSAFETSVEVMHGYVVDQGLTIGPLSLGPGSLIGCLKVMNEEHPGTLQEFFKPDLDKFEYFSQMVLNQTATERLYWSEMISDRRDRRLLIDPWERIMTQLSKSVEYRDAVFKYILHRYYVRSCKFCESENIHSERGFALVCDCWFLRGSISPNIRERWKNVVATLNHETEEQRLIDLGNVMSGTSTNGYVKQRILADAKGSGRAYGLQFDLDEQFGISLLDVTPMDKEFFKKALALNLKYE